MKIMKSCSILIGISLIALPAAHALPYERAVGAPGVGVAPVPGAGAPGVGVIPGAGAGAPGAGVAPHYGAGGAASGAGALPGAGVGTAGKPVGRGPTNVNGGVNRAGRR